MEGKDRPYGVKLIARLELLAGIALVCFGIGILAFKDIITKGDISLSELGPDGLVMYGSASIGLGLVGFLVSIGTWSLSALGRKLALVSALVGIFVPVLLAGILGQMTFVFDLVVYPLIIYYLTREDVRKRFT